MLVHSTALSNSIYSTRSHANLGDPEWDVIWFIHWRSY